MMEVMELEVLGGGNGGIFSSRPSTQKINHIWGVGNYDLRGIIFVAYFYAWGSAGAICECYASHLCYALEDSNGMNINTLCNVRWKCSI